MKLPTFFPTLLLAVVLFSSCAEELTPVPVMAPIIPPGEQFIIPTDLLTRMTLHEDLAINQSHWLHSGIHLFAWHRSITQSTHLPLAALEVASKVKARKISPRMYEWRFEFQASSDQGEKPYEMN